MEDLKPSSREEAVLAKIAGIEDPMVDAFEPSSREEFFLDAIAAKAKGGAFVTPEQFGAVVSVAKTIIGGKVAFQVTGLAAGTANVTVRVRDNTSINAVCTISVA